MKYKAVFFDFDGTIRLNSVSPGDVIYQFLLENGFSLSDEDRQRAGRWEHYYWAQSRELLQDSERLGFATEAFWRHYITRRLKAFGLPRQTVEALAAEAAEYMSASYHPDSLLPPSLPPTLKSLKAQGYLLGIFSNRREDYTHEVASLGLETCFDVTVVAGQLQSWKPDVEGFQHLLEISGVKADESVYIGDNYFADVIGARRAGMFPILYNARGLFIEPDCTAITCFNQLLDVLEEN